MPEPGSFTWRGPDAVERRIEQDQALVRDAVIRVIDPHRLSALVLAGGYGRGEGGYRWIDGRPLPFNDYDYFVVVNGLGRRALGRLRAELAALGHRLSAALGLEVDFAVLDERRLDRLPANLMYSELKWGHRTLAGNAACLDAIRSPPPDQLPLAEATRTLLNRGALLLMNGQALRRGEVANAIAAEQFERYLCKAILAAGEALLASRRQYHPLLRVRQDRLEACSSSLPEGFLALHRCAADYKFGRVAVAATGGSPEERYRQAVDAWCAALQRAEATRCGSPIASWKSYAMASVSKGQGRTGLRGVVTHVMLHLVHRRRRQWLKSPASLWRHPRERLLASLPLLLTGTGDDVSAPALRALGLPPGTGWSRATDVFLEAWRRYC